MVLTTVSKIAEAEKLKDIGVKLFKEEKYAKAAKRFLLAINYVKGLVDSSNEYLHLSSTPVEEGVICEEDAIRSNLLHVSCCSNLVACQLKLGKYEAAVAKCDKGLSILEKKKQFFSKLDIKKFEAKFLARKAKCLQNQKKFSKGARILREAIGKYPQNSLVRSTYKEFQVKHKIWLNEQIAKQQEEFRNIF